MTLNSSSKRFLALASFSMALAIGIGAFGAHGLKALVSADMLKVYHTGVQYHFYNTLGLFALGILVNFISNPKKINIAFYFILLGMILFSGSLYALVVFSLPVGLITPIGGLLMIIGWLIATFGIVKS